MAVKKFTRDQLNTAMKEARKRYSHRKNITGFDVGYKWVKGNPTKEHCVRIHVEEKIPTSQLENAEIFPSDIDGVPLDIIQGPYRTNLTPQPSSHRDRFAMLMGGISCGRDGPSTGTLGALVIENSTQHPAILSNWHVLVGPNGRVGDRVIQPGSVDTPLGPSGEIARLSNSILDIDGDAAVATLSGRRQWLPIQYGNFVVPKGIRDSRLGEILQKSGRTTGVTQGRVDGEGIYRLRYEVRPGVEEIREIAGFKLVHETPGNTNDEELSGPGDSGSLWIHPTSGEAVGLHFAGEMNPNPRAEHAIACNMTRVTERLDLRLATFEEMLEIVGAQSKADAMSAPPRARGLGPREITPRPDDPDGPSWPWTGPYPWPWPWGPTGPWDPRIDPRDLRSGGEVPWPLWRNRSPWRQFGSNHGEQPSTSWNQLESLDCPLSYGDRLDIANVVTGRDLRPSRSVDYYFDSLEAKEEFLEEANEILRDAGCGEISEAEMFDADTIDDIIVAMGS